MSDALKLITAALAAGSMSAVTGIEQEMLLGNEVQVYDFVKAHHRQYREMPQPATVTEETGVRLPRADESLEYYIVQVNERHDYNMIRNQFAPMRDALQHRNLTQVQEAVAAMNRQLNRRNRQGGGQVQSLSEAGQQVIDRLSQIRGTGGVSGIITGWERFDSITGGYQDSDLITWVGRMGLGKTYILLQQARKAHHAGHSVLFISPEMAIEPIARRYGALETGVNPTLLKNGMVSTYMQRRLQRTYRDMVGADRFKIFAVGMNSKFDAIMALCQEYQPDILFIDGVYLIRPSEMGKNMSQTEKVSALYDEMRGFNLDMRIPFVVATQFSRMAGKGGKEGSLETIGYSDRIGTNSSQIIALKDGPTENPRDSRIFDFLKGREGETGEVAINFKFAPLNMDEMTMAEREAGGEPEDTTSWMGVDRRQSTGRRANDPTPESEA